MPIINPLTDRTFEVEREDEEREVLVNALMDWTSDKRIQSIMLGKLGLEKQKLREFAVVLVDTKTRLSGNGEGGLPLRALRRITAELLDNGPARKRIARNVAKREELSWRDVNESLLEFRDGIREELE